MLCNVLLFASACLGALAFFQSLRRLVRCSRPKSSQPNRESGLFSIVFHLRSNPSSSECIDFRFRFSAPKAMMFRFFLFSCCTTAACSGRPGFVCVLFSNLSIFVLGASSLRVLSKQGWPLHDVRQPCCVGLISVRGPNFSSLIKCRMRLSVFFAFQLQLL